MRLTALALTAAAWAPAAAAELVSPDAFEALSVGRTLHFTFEGRRFGSEQYFSGRRSLWRFADGSCVAGAWHAQGSEICFVYEGDPATVCWVFLREGDRYSALLVDDAAEGGFSLELDGQGEEPLACDGPDVTS